MIDFVMQGWAGLQVAGRHPADGITGAQYSSMSSLKDLGMLHCLRPGSNVNGRAGSFHKRSLV
jgi:hypothetical protein